MAVRRRTKKGTPPQLAEGDVVVSLSSDAAYMALLDVEGYDKDLPDWDYGSLTRKIVQAMNAGHLVAWGCPEVEVNVRITVRPLGKRAASKVVATASGVLSTTGVLCLAGYTSLTMCAQFEEERFPQTGDTLLRVSPGSYHVDVHRCFAHRAGQQFPVDDELPDGDHYVVVLRPLARGTSKPRARRDVAWAPKAS